MERNLQMNLATSNNFKIEDKFETNGTVQDTQKQWSGRPLNEWGKYYCIIAIHINTKNLYGNVTPQWMCE
jgi:hypothetical protein